MGGGRRFLILWSWCRRLFEGGIPDEELFSTAESVGKLRVRGARDIIKVIGTTWAIAESPSGDSGVQSSTTQFTTRVQWDWYDESDCSR